MACAESAVVWAVAALVTAVFAVDCALDALEQRSVESEAWEYVPED